MKKLLAATALGLCAASAQAETIDLNFGSGSLRAALVGPLSRLGNSLSGQYDVGAVYKEEEKNSLDPKDAQLTLLHAAALATGDVGATGAEAAAGLGARLIYARRSLAGQSGQGGALALGGQFDVRMPGFERLGFSGYAWFAPGITSFSDLDGYSEFALGAEFEVVRAASVYAGYRLVNTKPEGGGEDEADSGAHIGLRLNF